MITNKTSKLSWFPLSALPKLSGDIAWMLADSKTQLAGLENSLAKRQTPDALLIDRLIKYNTEIASTLELYREQLDAWLSGDVAAAESFEVERLRRQLPELKNILDKILELCAVMKTDNPAAMVGSDTTRLPISELYKLAGQNDLKRDF